MRESSSVKLKFDGDHHQVSIDLFIDVLQDYARIAREVNKEISSTTEVDIEVSAIAKGSLDAVLNIASYVPDGVLDFTTVTLRDITSTIIGTTAGIYLMRKLSAEKGTPVQATKEPDDKVRLTYSDNSQIVINNPTFNISVENDHVNSALDNTFKALSKGDSSVTGLAIYEDQQELFSVSSSMFTQMSKIEIPEGEKTRKKIEDGVTIGITRAVFVQSQTRMWEFSLRGIKVPANITDSDFLEEFGKGNFSFAVGDELIAKIEITQVLNEESNVWENKKYTLTKIYEHKPRPVTSSLIPSH